MWPPVSEAFLCLFVCSLLLHPSPIHEFGHGLEVCSVFHAIPSFVRKCASTRGTVHSSPGTSADAVEGRATMGDATQRSWGAEAMCFSPGTLTKTTAFGFAWLSCTNCFLLWKYGKCSKVLEVSLV